MNMKKSVIIGFAFLAIILTILFAMIVNAKKEKDKFLDRHNLNDLNILEMVTMLESELEEDKSLKASINSEELILMDESNNYSFKLPGDKFYLSFAPYLNNTHPCSTHNLITCRGELSNTNFSVSVYDNKNNIIYEDDVLSFENGFVGVWLPKNIEGKIIVTYNGKTAEAHISTFKSSNTCLTSLKLS